jgi:hypothetical protein
MARFRWAGLGRDGIRVAGIGARIAVEEIEHDGHGRVRFLRPPRRAAIAV